MNQSDCERTYKHGDAAMQYLRAHQTPAYPNNYELWYTYSCGFNKALNTALNALIGKRGTLTAIDTQRIYDEHLSPARLGSKVDEVGSLVSDEINDITTLLDHALTSAGEYGRTLRGAGAELDSSSTQQDVAEIVRRLVRATVAMQGNNTELERQLMNSREQIHQLRESIETIRHESLTDQLTGIANRKHFDYALALAVDEAHQDRAPLSLIFCDIDHFKQFNDTHGHQTGDQVLRLVGSTLRNNVKGQDLPARYGGEEFAIILPHTVLGDAVKVAWSINKAIRTKELVKRSTNTNLGRITMSLGVVGLASDDTPETMVHRADVCLYAAKSAGRDCVKSEQDGDVASLPDVA